MRGNGRKYRHRVRRASRRFGVQSNATRSHLMTHRWAAAGVQQTHRFPSCTFDRGSERVRLAGRHRNETIDQVCSTSRNRIRKKGRLGSHGTSSRFAKQDACQPASPRVRQELRRSNSLGTRESGQNVVAGVKVSGCWAETPRSHHGCLARMIHQSRRPVGANNCGVGARSLITNGRRASYTNDPR